MYNTLPSLEVMILISFLRLIISEAIERDQQVVHI
jgi:hypothetical protein